MKNGWIFWDNLKSFINKIFIWGVINVKLLIYDRSYNLLMRFFVSEMENFDFETLFM